MHEIRHPRPDFTGEAHGVTFVDGYATVTDPVKATELAAAGCSVDGVVHGHRLRDAAVEQTTHR